MKRPFISYPLIESLEDETLFSLSSRLHRFWGHSSGATTSRHLFRQTRGSSNHDFPCGLGEFVARTRGAYGSVNTVALERTLLRFYRPFLSNSEVDRTIAQMAGQSVAHLKLRIGILTSRFRANHVLKACRSCMQEDARDTGWVYWHASHQWPGVWTCLKHRTPLWQSTVKSNGVERFLWHLPSASRLAPGLPVGNAKSLTALHELTAFTNLLVGADVPCGMISLKASTEAFRHALSGCNLITTGGRLRLAAASSMYLDHCSRIRVVPDLAGLPSDLETAKIQLGRMLRDARSGTHPMRILSIASWLFRSAQDFVDALGAQTSPVPESQAPRPDLAEAADERRSSLVRQMASGQSARAAAVSVGVTVGTAMSWATQAGLTVQIRPKTLNAARRADLQALLRTGMPKAKAAEVIGVTVQAVTRLLQTEVGLRSAWQTAKFEQARTTARNEWAVAASSAGQTGTKDARAAAPSVFAWLYRNDREWLQQHKPVAGKGMPRASSVQWTVRDQELRTAVQAAARHLEPLDRSGRIRLWQIVQAVPELKPHLRSMRRLPLTAGAISDVQARKTS